MRTSNRLFRTLPVLAAGLALIASGCQPEAAPDTAEEGSQDLPEVIAQTGTLRVGLSPDFPPMEYREEESGELTGVDVQLANALGAQLGVEIEFVEQAFDQLLNSVQTGRVDVVMSGLSDTVERQKTVDFVDYFKSQGRLYTLEADAADYTDATQTCGKTIAVSKKTDYYAQLQTFNKETCADAGKPEIELLPTDSGSAARLQLEQKRVDLAMQGQENLAYFEKKDASQFDIVLDPFPSKPFGIVLKKGDAELSTAILNGMTALAEDGSYAKILTENEMEYAIMTPALNGTKS